MADSGAVQPALSREQWAKHTTGWRHTTAAADVDEQAMHTTHGVWVGRDRHALAALALYGQPFGFSHEDLKVLRDEAEFVEWGGLGDPDRADEEIDAAADEPYISPGKRASRIRDIAARIAALLPPG